jgi:hypothetical protein
VWWVAISQCGVYCEKEYLTEPNEQKFSRCCMNNVLIESHRGVGREAFWILRLIGQSSLDIHGNRYDNFVTHRFVGQHNAGKES